MPQIPFRGRGGRLALLALAAAGMLAAGCEAYSSNFLVPRAFYDQARELLRRGGIHSCAAGSCTPITGANFTATVVLQEKPPLRKGVAICPLDTGEFKYDEATKTWKADCPIALIAD